MGTVTVKLVVEAAVTLAFVAPKKTMLLAGVALKLLPVMVTIVPIGPLVGEKPLIEGTCPYDLKPVKESTKTNPPNKYLTLIAF